MSRLIFFSLVLALSSGCAGDRHARQLAARVLQQTVKYEAEVDKKVAAERAFYADQRELIRHTLGGNSAITNPDAASVVKIERTLAYGRIRTNAERGARLLGAEILASNPPMITVQMIEYIEGGVKDDQTFYLAAFERQRQLTIDLLANLEKIEQQKLRLRTVRNHLTALATQPTLSAQLTEIIQFAQSVEEQVKRQQQK